VSYITTFSGGTFRFLDPASSDIRLKDIAHALSCVNRFTGHLTYPISVAQHSVMVYHLVARQFPEALELQRIALLHDATEAYLCDVSSPLKNILGPTYRDLEFKTHNEIMKRFGLPMGPLPAEVKLADKIALRLEAERGLPPQPWTKTLPAGKVPGSLQTPWRHSKAERFFLDVAKELELQ
jgi:hypothetical protein